MSVRRSEDFISDVERQFEWYATNADWDVAEHYLEAVETTSQLIGQHPLLGPNAGLTHPRLANGGLSSSYAHFKNTFCFTKSPLKIYCFVARCTDIEICRNDCLKKLEEIEKRTLHNPLVPPRFAFGG